MNRSGASSERQPAISVSETLDFARPGARRLVLASLLGAGAAGAGIGLLATSAWLISRASQHPKETALAVGIVAVQFFGLSRGLCRYGQRLVGHDAALRALSALRVQVWERLIPLAPAGASVFRGGDLLARFISDVETVQDLLVRVIGPFAIAAGVGAAAVALVWWVLPAAGLVLLAAFILSATALPWLAGVLVRREEVRQAGVGGELTAAVVDLLTGAAELTAYGAVEQQLERTAAIDARRAQIERQRARTAGIGQALATLLPGLAMVGGLLLGVTAVRAGRLDVVLLAVIGVVPLAASELVSGLPAATQTLQRLRGSLGRTRQVLEAAPLLVDPALPKALPAGAAAIQVRGLRCRYRESGPWVLDGLDLDLVPGRPVALVGRSGAGKSTLAHVLLRFLPYEGGSITLGGVELHDLAGDGCRDVIGLVAQDAHIFNTSLAANLRVACPGASEEELRQALRQVRLLDWTDELPLGLATEVGEFGLRMSGGQRQRLAAARALLADFHVLILDEPAEYLDTATADAILADLLTAAPNQAILLITHRLTGLDGVSEVIVLDAGRAIERGSHAELVAADGAYAELWRTELAEL